MRGNVSITQAAKVLGIAPVTLRRWVRERRVAHVRLGRRVVLQSDDLAKFIALNRVEASATMQPRQVDLLEMAARAAEEGDPSLPRRKR